MIASALVSHIIGHKYIVSKEFMQYMTISVIDNQFRLQIILNI